MHNFSHSKNIIVSSFMVFLVCLALLLSVRSVAHAASPNITLSPNFGPPTSVIKVSGKSFGSNEMVSVDFDATLLATITTSITGTFSLTLPIPSSALPGNHVVQASGQSSGFLGQATFLVQTNWAQFGFGPQHTHFNSYENVLNTTNVSLLVKKWNAATGNFIDSSPAIANGVVYIGSEDGLLHAFDAATGAFLCSYTTPSRSGISSSPTVANGLVFFGSDKLYVLSATTCALQWTYSSSDLNARATTPTVVRFKC